MAIHILEIFPCLEKGFYLTVDTCDEAVKQVRVADNKFFNRGFLYVKCPIVVDWQSSIGPQGIIISCEFSACNKISQLKYFFATILLSQGKSKQFFRLPWPTLKKFI